MNNVAHINTQRPSKPLCYCICGRPARKPRLKSPISIAAAYYPDRWSASLLRKAHSRRLGFSPSELSPHEWSEVLDEAAGIKDDERMRRHGKNATERRARLEEIRSKLEILRSERSMTAHETFDAAAE